MYLGGVLLMWLLPWPLLSEHCVVTFIILYFDKVKFLIIFLEHNIMSLYSANDSYNKPQILP